jgi:hypothetical protein
VQRADRGDENTGKPAEKKGVFIVKTQKKSLYFSAIEMKS